MVGKKTAVRKCLAGEDFILLEPRLPSDAEKTARAIAACRGVRRVFMTSGRFGFIVSTNSARYSPEQVNSAVIKAAGRVKAKVINGHYVYSSRLSMGD